MKKFIIANWGHGNQGKSNTVKRLTKLILEHYTTSITSPVEINFTGDVKTIITIEELKIGIESQGDPNSRLFESLKEFSKKSCSIIICATRTSGATVDAVNNLKKSHNYDVIWVTNYRSMDKNQEELNQISASHHFELIKKLIG
ncbi:MAG: hypothetical protein Q8T03_13265 [Bacteroidota bacterium]|nr:hypothetical protein [Bacteroidota bacterium]